jgi:xylulokinase
MECLMGIDIGTSSVKTMLVATTGNVVAVHKENYDIQSPILGYAEQDPELWYEKTCITTRKVLEESGIAPKDVKAISFSGQMHGLVCLDKNGKILYPAIIWPDQRTAEIIPQMYDILGEEYVVANTQNKISTGFLIASLYWLFKCKPDIYAKIDKVIFPKDYIKYRITGEVVTDYSDAAGGLAFDNIKSQWAKEMIERLGLDFSLFPRCTQSVEAIGRVSITAELETGLSRETKVINGGSDQCMQGIGNGIIEEGIFAANIGTGGQVSTCLKRPLFDPRLRINTFAHVIPGCWNMMGACLSSGNSLKWLMQKILNMSDYGEIDEGSAKLPIGSEKLIFLPYLAGERTPHLDPMAKGIFCGLSLKHTKYHLIRAVIEGVTFSLKDCMSVFEEMEITCQKIIASGGGANSKIWLQMQADIFNKVIYKSVISEQACLGAVITAGVGSGEFADFKTACDLFVKYDDTVYEPIEKNVKQYNEYYQVFRELYQANKKIYQQLNRI